MAKKSTRRTRQSGLVERLGQKGQAAYEEHKNDAVVFSQGGDLPAGIKGGIAQLVECKFGIYDKGDNKGEFFWYTAGIVVSPKEHEGIRIEGLRTSQREAMCDTPNTLGKKKTQNDHLEWLFNEFRKLGVEPGDYPNFLSELEDTIAPALKEAAPYFRFRTWSMDDSDFVNHDWQGICGYNLEEDETGEVEEEIVDTEEEEPEATEDTEEEEIDRAALAALADDGDEDAEAKLTDKAEALGLDPNDYRLWVDVEEAMTVQEAEGTEESKKEEEETASPEKGDVWRYKRPGSRELADYEVTLVSSAKETVSLKSLDDNKLFKNVPWSKLIPTE